MLGGKFAKDRLPEDPTPFIGRSLEAATATDKLRAARLVSFVGIGGIGKTRLAKEVAKRSVGDYPDGVHFVDLSVASSDQLVEHTILDSLGLDTSPAALLRSLLADGSCLLVLDRCEGVVTALGPIVADLIAWCPGVKILATTRTELGVAGENIYLVPPLSTESPDGEGISDAAKLFIARSQAVTGRPVPEAGLHDVDGLCRHLDGIPLAIELAAGRTRSMTALEIRTHLDQRFEILRDAPGGASHQTSLESVLAWTWERCTAPEQELWMAMSVLGGAVTADTIAAVQDVVVDVELLNTVDRLTAKSILISEQTSATRYRLLDTVSSFGLLKAQSILGDELVAAMRDRHLDHCVGTARTAFDEWFGADQSRILANLESSIGNFRAAFEWSLADASRAHKAVALYAFLWPHWIAGGHIKESLLWVERLGNRTAPNAAEMCAHLLTKGWAQLLGGLRAEAEESLERCHEAALEADCAEQVFLSKALLGCCVAIRGHGTEGIALLQNALRGAQGRVRPWALSMLLELNAELRALYGDRQVALEQCDECEQICLEHGDVWCHGLVSWVRSLVYYLEGEYARAYTEARRTLELKASVQDLLGVALASEVVAWSLAMQQENSFAAELLGMTGRYWQHSGSELLIGIDVLSAQRERVLEQLFLELGTDAVELQQRVEPKIALMNFPEVVATFAARRLPTALTSSVRVDDASRPERTHGGFDAPASPMTGGLTRRQSEVARLVAEGKTNREIADALFIGIRTVDTHVAQVLRKLNVTRRVEVARLMVSSENTQTSR
ncbi:hypothetical protein MHEL_31750 [Mycolicibacterium helvum]|uniref:HTH luxR-type domain-containing protein n=2 Tax=Mycolicibacterium helvum TaxID=1534349 RepID=A0A7I7T6P8_9MYCO|nr:hypothetical protein MHEL_31750 [Mycolicibacterium helvum]